MRKWSPRRFRRPKFRLLTLLLLVAVAAVAMVPLARAHRNRRIEEICRKFEPVDRCAPPRPKIAEYVPASIANELWPLQGEPMIIWLHDNRVITDADLDGFECLTRLECFLPPHQNVCMSPDWFTGHGLPPMIDEVMRRHTGNHITDAGVKRLTGLRVLCVLNLSRSRITDAALRDIAKIPGITRLSLAGTRITDDGLRYLANHPGIGGLDLSDTAITDEGLRHLAGNPGIGVLDLRDTAITDGGLEYLSRLPHISSLRLDGTRVTDAAAEILGRMKGLRTLSIARTAFTYVGGEKLRAALPDAPELWCEGCGQPRAQ